MECHSLAATILLHAEIAGAASGAVWYCRIIGYWIPRCMSRAGTLCDVREGAMVHSRIGRVVRARDAKPAAGSR